MPDQKEKPKNERKRVTNLRVGEISFVDRPAVPKAKILIFKRKGGGNAMPNETVKGELEKIGVCDECIEKVGDRFGYEDNGMRQGENAMEALRRNTSLLVSLRRNFPRQIRELVMALDMAIDDFSRRAKEDDSTDKKADHPDCPEGMVYDPAKGKCVTEAKDKKEEDKKEEDKKDEKKEVKKEEDNKEVKKEEEETEKGKKVGCPEGMIFSEEEGKCVPDRTNTPRRKSAGDTDQEPTATVDGLGFTEEEKSRLGKLVAGENK
jgi:hypothetical protein